GGPMGGPGGGLPPPPPPGFDPDGGLPPPLPGGGPLGGHLPPLPDPAALEACHGALDTCLRDVSQTAASCFSAGRDCDRAAFQAAFTQFCNDALARCSQSGSNADECAK